MDAKEPLMIENVKTPAIIKTTQKIYSMAVDPDMSPYPTVVIVVTMK